jgi:blue copper oxidase
MIVTDGADQDRGLPASYGVDDLPIVLQDKRFGRDGEQVYEPTMMDLMRGFRGNTLLVNGAIGPVANVPAGFMRLRLLNAANARNDSAGDQRRSLRLQAMPVFDRTSRSENWCASRAIRNLVNFSDGGPIDLVTAPDVHGGMGSGMI